MIKKKQFTLMELVTALILFGMTLSFLGGYMASVTQAYIMTRSQTEATHRAQFAIERITRELTLPNIVDIDVTSTAITIVGGNTNSISFSGDTILVDNNTDRPLLSGVQTASFSEDLSSGAITINIDLEDITNNNRVFSTTVYPRRQ